MYICKIMESNKRDYIWELQFQQYKRDLEHLDKKLKFKIYTHLWEVGEISNDEFAKVLLDETGDYHPKLISDDITSADI